MQVTRRQASHMARVCGRREKEMLVARRPRAPLAMPPCSANSDRTLMSQAKCCADMLQR